MTARNNPDSFGSAWNDMIPRMSMEGGSNNPSDNTYRNIGATDQGYPCASSAFDILKGTGMREVSAFPKHGRKFGENIGSLNAPETGDSINHNNIQPLFSPTTLSSKLFSLDHVDNIFDRSIASTLSKTDPSTIRSTHGPTDLFMETLADPSHDFVQPDSQVSRSAKDNSLYSRYPTLLNTSNRGSHSRMLDSLYSERLAPMRGYSGSSLDRVGNKAGLRRGIAKHRPYSFNGRRPSLTHDTSTSLLNFQSMSSPFVNLQSQPAGSSLHAKPRSSNPITRNVHVPPRLSLDKAHQSKSSDTLLGQHSLFFANKTKHKFQATLTLHDQASEEQRLKSTVAAAQTAAAAINFEEHLSKATPQPRHTSDNDPFQFYRSRYRSNPYQVKILESVFAANHSPGMQMYESIATKLGMPVRSVYVYFQNMRAKKRVSLNSKAKNYANSTSAIVEPSSQQDQLAPWILNSMNRRTDQDVIDTRSTTSNSRSCPVSPRDNDLTIDNHSVTEEPSHEPIATPGTGSLDVLLCASMSMADVDSLHPTNQGRDSPGFGAQTGKNGVAEDVHTITTLDKQSNDGADTSLQYSQNDSWNDQGVEAVAPKELALEADALYILTGAHADGVDM